MLEVVVTNLCLNLFFWPKHMPSLLCQSKIGQPLLFQVTKRQEAPIHHFKFCTLFTVYKPLSLVYNTWNEHLISLQLPNNATTSKGLGSPLSKGKWPDIRGGASRRPVLLPSFQTYSEPTRASYFHPALQTTAPRWRTACSLKIAPWCFIISLSCSISEAKKGTAPHLSCSTQYLGITSFQPFSWRL